MANLADQFAIDGGAKTIGNSSRSSNLLLLLKAQEKEYQKRYGGSPESWRTLGTASLLAADFTESYADQATMEMQLSQAEIQRKEFSARGDKLLSLMSKQGAKVVDEQQAAFTKAGVKFSGSALNVMTESIIKADDATLQKKRELDYQKSQMQVQQTMAQAKLDRAPLETLISMGSTYAYASTK